MTLCRSKSFDSLFRNSECSKGLRLIPFWQQCQQKQPREFQCRDAHNVFYLHKVLKHMRVNLHWTVGRELHWGQKSSTNICSANAAAASHVCPHMAVQGWADGTTLPGIHSPQPPAHLTSPFFSLEMPFHLAEPSRTWALSSRAVQTVCMLCPAPAQYNDTILFFHGKLLSPKKEHMLCS